MWYQSVVSSNGTFTLNGVAHPIATKKGWYRESVPHKLHIRYRWLMFLIIVVTVVMFVLGFEALAHIMCGVTIEGALHHIVEFMAEE
jgi:hypothetical protein